MSIEVNELLGDARAAERAAAWHDALAAYRDAGDHARRIGLRRAARRCYLRALELDLLDASIVERLACVDRAVPAWQPYVAALPAMRATWRAINARFAQLVADDTVTALIHPAIAGSIARVEIGASDDLWLARAPACASVPDAMLLLLVRRTLWHAPRELPPEPVASTVVHVEGDGAYRLFETGDWEASLRVRPALRVACAGAERAQCVGHAREAARARSVALRPVDVIDQRAVLAAVHVQRLATAELEAGDRLRDVLDVAIAGAEHERRERARAVERARGIDVDEVREIDRRAAGVDHLEPVIGRAGGRDLVDDEAATGGRRRHHVGAARVDRRPGGGVPARGEQKRCEAGEESVLPHGGPSSGYTRKT
jgi:hypothetical protein